MSTLGFQDESRDCAICLEPLEEQVDGATSQEENKNNHDDTAPRRVLTLQCGHKWHYDCLVQQLQTVHSMTSNGSNQRLIFTGCQCAKCGQICEHPALEHLTRATDVLRSKVDVMLEEQLQMDAPEMWKRVSGQFKETNEFNKDNSLDRNRVTTKEALLQEARRKYAFYLCSHCNNPYFGGTIECADELGIEDDNGPPEQRLCTACAPQSQSICRNPQEHGRFLIWKCRYCCQPSTHVCYGNVHFCDSCHEKNSRRVREIHQERQDRNRQVKPPPLPGIACTGKSCRFPKPGSSAASHNNGSSIECEQVYSCVFCESNSERGHEHALEPGSGNLIVNPSGAAGLHGWQQLNRRMAWTVEMSESPLNGHTTTNFVSSFLDCVMMQEINLSQILKPPEQWTGSIRIEVSARYMGRTDCPSVFRLKTFLSWKSHHHQSALNPIQVFERSATSQLDAPPDYWEHAHLELSVDPSRLQNLQTISDDCSLTLHVVVIGKDRRFWQGRYGSKVCDISARILGTATNLEGVLLEPPDSLENNREQDSDED